MIKIHVHNSLIHLCLKKRQGLLNACAVHWIDTFCLFLSADFSLRTLAGVGATSRPPRARHRHREDR